MRITLVQLTIILTLFGSAFAKSSRAQAALETRVSISESNKSLKSVLRTLESKSHVSFTFVSELINADQKVNLSANDLKLSEVLDLLLSPINLSYEVSGNVIVIRANKELQQNVMTIIRPEIDLSRAPIKGNVVDEKGLPLPGVSVKIKGTQTGTVTDVNGDFSLNVAPGTVLIVSYIGFETQEVTAGTEPVKVKLVSSSSSLNEVVVVGATFKKSDLTGAVASIESKTLEERPVTNVGEALQGRVSGVFVSGGSKPSDDASIRIRGINTINSGSSPIYVVDGLVMENNQGGFKSINLNDVSSVQVLKDASATALYAVGTS